MTKPPFGLLMGAVALAGLGACMIDDRIIGAVLQNGPPCALVMQLQSYCMRTNLDRTLP